MRWGKHHDISTPAPIAELLRAMQGRIGFLKQQPNVTRLPDMIGTSVEHPSLGDEVLYDLFFFRGFRWNALLVILGASGHFPLRRNFKIISRQHLKEDLG